MLSYVLPTRNRPERLLKTLEALVALDERGHEPIGGMEVIVVDNDSDSRVVLESAIASRLHLRIIELDQNVGAAARNVGVEHAQVGEDGWIIMLDDDSHPLNCGHVDLLLRAPDEVVAIGADIFLPDGSRERGGLPEVIIGCGAAIRKRAFLEVGGYDASFNYYAEEYDLCAKLLLAGWRIVHDSTGAFRVLHEKTTVGRDFKAIAQRLVRNNAWVMQRYAPESYRSRQVARIIERYADIAVKEHAAIGFAAGMRELVETIAEQPRTPMSTEVWSRFTGASAAKHALSEVRSGTRVAIVEEGKSVEVIREVLETLSAEIVADAAAADEVVIGTLSPGPMRDAWRRSGGRAIMCG